MRVRMLGCLAAVVGLVQLAGVGSPGARAEGGPVITDAAGDATQFVVDAGLPSEVNEPGLDILSADIAVTTETVTTSVTVAALSLSPPRGATGQFYRWYFTYGGMEFHTRAALGADGTPVFTVYDPSLTAIPCPACTGSFDVASNTVTVQVPLAVVNDRIASLSGGRIPGIGTGAELSALEVLAQRQVSAPVTGGVTPTADIATTERIYTVTAPRPPRPFDAPNPDEKDDAVVIAVIDFNLVPYHWDFDAGRMPQHLDGDASNDLPLSSPPDTWLSGFPATDTFTSYEALPLSVGAAAADPSASIEDLAEQDAEVWESVPQSYEGDIEYRWIPGTKVIGAVDFGGSTMRGAPDDHGVGVTSVSVGNLHGTCPECLLVFINIASPTGVLDTVGAVSSKAYIEAAVNWATSQPWIDVVTNSWGINQVGGYVRDNVYPGEATLAGTREASERGQTVFFSAGNGIENGFIVPNSTYTSAVKGPDWMMTVGAITPAPPYENFSGAGKPVDLSGVGTDYPSAYTATTVSSTGAEGFSGTSNATPTVAGLYGRALWAARRALPGASRVQGDGVVAAGPAVACGAAAGGTGGAGGAGCELGDGVLTASELRTRLLEGASPTSNQTSLGGVETVPHRADERFASEGHGAYTGRVTRLDDVWLGEFERVFGPMVGSVAPPARPAGEREWMTADSYCRQKLWGAWPGGYYQSDSATPVAAADFQAWPLRSSLSTTCSLTP